MNSDKRRYKSRENNRKDKPVFPSGNDAGRDGYTIRSRKSADDRGNPYAWGRNDYVAPTLRDPSNPFYDD